MSYGQVWYEDRHGHPYFLVAGMRVYQTTTGKQHTRSGSDLLTAKNTLLNQRSSYPTSHQHSLASAAYEGYAASQVPRVRFADDLPDRDWNTEKHSRRRSIREPSSSTPNIVPWPSAYEPKNTKHSNHRASHYGKNEHITIVTAEPRKKTKKYSNEHTYYHDEVVPEPRRRSSSRESYGRPTTGSHGGSSRYFHY